MLWEEGWSLDFDYRVVPELVVWLGGGEFRSKGVGVRRATGGGCGGGGDLGNGEEREGGLASPEMKAVTEDGGCHQR
ncbi:hypothetical protein TIFTF001_033383 [Ficus carica]|uniref:Uncharacterized protein n=1 Tax=Ficus carica TaxID=3494 RepID=A0AA88DY51_FICCA|nr:hypothetical protein TIFTF001_033383 [Ficus carica]